MSSALVIAAGSVRPFGGSAQQDTKLYLPTDGRPAEFDGVVDVVVLVVERVEVVVDDRDEVVEDEVEDEEVVVPVELDEADLSR